MIKTIRSHGTKRFITLVMGRLAPSLRSIRIFITSKSPIIGLLYVPITKIGFQYIRWIWALIYIGCRPKVSSDKEHEALLYVGTRELEGLLQLKFLILEGLKPYHKVLEIGCGCLLAGYPIMRYLNKGNYYAIEPNHWLIEASLENERLAKITGQRAPHFSQRSDFRFSENLKFDYIISHSILTHTSLNQTKQFMRAVAAQLKPKGKALASCRYAEGNKFGSKGYAGSESDFTQWTYPNCSFISRNTLAMAAREANLEHLEALHFLAMMWMCRRTAIQDWFVLQIMKDWGSGSCPH